MSDHAPESDRVAAEPAAAAAASPAGGTAALPLRSWPAAVILLILACSYVLLQGGHIKLDEHECLVAQTAKEMLQTRDWLVPRFGGLVRLQKAPLPYWLVAVGGWANGRIDEWVVRLPAALGALGVVAACWYLGRCQFNGRVGWVAAVVSASSIGTLVYGHDGTADIVLTSLCAWCFALFWQAQNAGSRRGEWGYACAFWIVLGLAMLAKGPMPGPVVVLPLVLWLLWRRDREGLRRAHLLIGGLLFFAVVLPWVLYILGYVDAVAARWKSEFLDRFTGEIRESRREHPLYYVPVLFLLAFPWSLSVPEALAAPFVGRYRADRGPLVYVWLWAAANLIFFSIASFKRSHYILPAMPAVSLLLAVVLDRLFFGESQARPRTIKLTCMAIIAAAAVGLVIGVWYVRRHEPQLAGVSAPSAIVTLCGITLAASLYMKGFRAASFVSVALLGAGLYLLIWGRLGPRYHDNSDALRLAEAVEQAVPADAELCWVGRQDARVLFYGRRAIPRCVDPMDALEEFAGREKSAMDVWLWIGRQMDRRFRSSQPVYAIIKDRHFKLLSSMFKTPARVVREILPSGPDDGAPILIVTNVPSPPS